MRHSFLLLFIVLSFHAQAQYAGQQMSLGFHSFATAGAFSSSANGFSALQNPAMGVLVKAAEAQAFSQAYSNGLFQTNAAAVVIPRHHYHAISAAYASNGNGVFGQHSMAASTAHRIRSTSLGIGLQANSMVVPEILSTWTWQINAGMHSQISNKLSAFSTLQGIVQTPSSTEVQLNTTSMLTGGFKFQESEKLHLGIEAQYHFNLPVTALAFTQIKLHKSVHCLAGIDVINQHWSTGFLVNYAMFSFGAGYQRRQEVNSVAINLSYRLWTLAPQAEADIDDTHH